MSVGLLIITHNRIGADILATAGDILGDLPLKTDVIEIQHNSDYEQKLADAERSVHQLDSGDGVLILTDIFGATPSNIATRAAAGRHARVVAGINLPMVVRVLNYHRLSLENIVDKATSAGHDSVIEADKPD